MHLVWLQLKRYCEALYKASFMSRPFVVHPLAVIRNLQFCARHHFDSCQTSSLWQCFDNIETLRPPITACFNPAVYALAEHLSPDKVINHENSEEQSFINCVVLECIVVFTLNDRGRQCVVMLSVNQPTNRKMITYYVTNLSQLF